MIPLRLPSIFSMAMLYTPLETDQNFIRLILPRLRLDWRQSDQVSICCCLAWRWTLIRSFVIRTGRRLWYTLYRSRQTLSSSHCKSLLGSEALTTSDQERSLWVDALCINHSDMQERMHQVSRMSSIYEQASQVFVWLGEGWDGCEKAIEFLQKTGERFKASFGPISQS